MKNKIGDHLFSQEESKMNMSKNKTLNNNHYKEKCVNVSHFYFPL